MSPFGFPDASAANPAYVALALVRGIGRARLDSLAERFPSAAAVLEASYPELCSVRGLSKAAATAIRETGPASGERILASVVEVNGTAMGPNDPGFPAALHKIPDAPALLFAVGRIDLLATPSVAVVGSRDHSRYGATVCRDLAHELAAAGLTVVSGMARGLDAVAHAAALDAGGHTVGVLGNGLGVVYPAANRALYTRVAAAGCLVTEFPPGERPHAGSFPRRNRLISGLARATVVVEAGAGSGALITADCALTQGREVMAVPGPITSPVSVGTNRLLQFGAKPVLGPSDIVEEFGLGGTVPPLRLPADLSDQERTVLDQLEDGGRHVDDLQQAIGGRPGNLLAVLTSLEIRGLVVQDPGKVFRRETAISHLSLGGRETGG